ncbi:MAG: DUF4270 domain-containing protein [Bacteroides sp.]|nr:DUF4270 domain-containing protein [Bacteroides sp.]
MKRLLHTFSFSILICIFYSCWDDNNVAGKKWVESSFTNIYTDTCTVELSTILLDSIPTSGDTLAQIGHYKDDLRGNLFSSFYTEYLIPSGSISENSDYAYDSLTITLIPSNNYLGDTLAVPQTMYIHQLKEVIDLDTEYKYNVSDIAYDPEPLTTFTFTPYRGRKDTIERRLPDELGDSIFNMLKNSDLRLSNQDYFRSFFNGLAFFGDCNDNCINGFQVNDNSFAIKLYYRRLDATTTDQVIVFKPNTTYNFNKIEHDRTGTPFQELESGRENVFPSQESEHLVYMQALSGIYVNIEFPYLNDLNKLGELAAIESAELRLYPVQYTYGDQAPLPETLYLYTTNDEYVTDEYSDVQSGSLVIDEVYSEDTYYSFDITSFLQSNLGTSGNSRQKLMLMMPGDQFYSTVDGVIFGDREHPTSNSRLYVLYKTYNEK